MQRTFTKLRLRFEDIADPVESKIEGKVFTDCDLMGPAVLAFGPDSSISNASIINCDAVVMREGAYVNNALRIDNSTITGGRIVAATILISAIQVEEFTNMGLEPMSHYPQPRGNR